MATTANLPSLNVVYRPHLAGQIKTSIHSAARAQPRADQLAGRVPVPPGSRSRRPGTAHLERPSGLRYRELRRRTPAAGRGVAPRESHGGHSRSRCLVGLALRTLPRVSTQPLPGRGLRPAAGSRRSGGHREYLPPRAGRLPAARIGVPAQPEPAAGSPVGPRHRPRQARIGSRRALAQAGRPQTLRPRQRTSPGQLTNGPKKRPTCTCAAPAGSAASRCARSPAKSSILQGALRGPMSRSMSRAITRQAFLLAVPEALLAKSLAAETTRPKLLIVAAHPDDEYAVAATTYRLTRELGWAADHVVITNGEAGYRYSALAEAVYGVGLTGENQGRSRLPAIRRRETLAAGKVLGIRRHYFLDQRDSGFATDAASAPTSNWDHARRPLFPHRPAAPRALRRHLHPAAHAGNSRTPSRRHPARAGSRRDPARGPPPPAAGSRPLRRHRAHRTLPRHARPAALPHPWRASGVRLRPRCPLWLSQRSQLPNRRQLVYRRTQVAGPVSNRFRQAPVGAVLAV